MNDVVTQNAVEGKCFAWGTVQKTYHRDTEARRKTQSKSKTFETRRNGGSGEKKNLTAD
jgi:hypothetical protein